MELGLLTDYIDMFHLLLYYILGEKEEKSFKFLKI